MNELIYDTDVSGVMVTLTVSGVSVTLPTVSYTLASLPDSPTVDASGVPIDSPTVSDVIADVLATLPDTPTVDASGATLVRVSTFVWCMRLILKCLRPSRPLTSLPPVMRD